MAEVGLLVVRRENAGWFHVGDTFGLCARTFPEDKLKQVLVEYC